MMEKKSAPELRFEGFVDDWEQQKLGNNVNFYSGLTYSPDNIVDNGTLVLRSSNVKNGEIVDADNVYVNPKFANSQNVIVGDVIVVVRNGSRNLIGKHASVKKNMNNTVIGAFMTGIRSKVPAFTNALLDSNQFTVEINKNLGATINQITTGEFKKMKFFFPSNDEQEKIGSLFNQLDNTIALHQRKLNQLQKFKRGFIQVMFLQKGENVPRLRFINFKDKWEQRKFKDFISKAGKKNIFDENYLACSVSNKLGLVSQKEQFDGSRLEYLDKTSYKLVNPNEFAYNPARINVGSIAFNNLNRTVIVSSLYVVIKMSKELDNDFILQYIKSQFFIDEVRRNTEGSVREYLFYENFKNIKFPYTSSKAEQIKIGDLFKQLDNTIALHQTKLDKLQSLKKAYLQKLFI